MAIRDAVERDAAALLELKLALDRETPLMMFEPGERSENIDEARQEIRDRIAEPNSALIVADCGRGLCGYIEAVGAPFRRRRHVATIVAGVDARYRGAGIGSRLFDALTAWSNQAGVRRLELTVMSHNAQAIRLYERYGFVREGELRCSMYVDGEWVDEFLMAKVSPDGFAATPLNE